MITFVRTATIAPGKLVEAMGFAHQVGQHVEKITGLKVVVATPVGGNPFRIAWVTAQANLAAVEANNDKLLGDVEYMRLVESSGPLFLPGSAHDEMWRSA
jgi:hypothetical protein